MIQVKNLTKRYGDRLAVDNLSFTIEAGKIYGFLGPNGAGKSTTMNMMTGYIASTKGEIWINGHNILEEAEEAKACIGYLPEQPPLYMDMTVYEYLLFTAELKNIEKSQRSSMIEEVMDLVQISDVKGRLIKNLSKGYKQRVGLAQAILGYPDILILDEPTVGLDPKQIIEIRDLIKKLGEKHTVILSSHILSEISAVCDHVLIISHGRLAASDTTENLSKLAMGSDEIRLTVRGEEKRIKDLLSALSGVEKVESRLSEEADSYDLVVSGSEGQDLRENIFYALAAEKMPILMMERVSLSLEDIFLELTQEKNHAGIANEDMEEGDRDI